MADIGSTPSLIVGIAAGAAASAALEPALERPKQDAWASQPNRIISASLMAALLAQGGVDLGTAQDHAKRDGFNHQQFAALTYLAQTVPGWAQALDLWRRDRITDAEFTHTLVKAGMDQRYIDQLLAYKTNELIPPPDLAYMVVRDLVPNPFVGGGPTGPDDNTIEDIPVLQIDALAEAARSGWDQTRFEALVGRSGLAPAPGLAAQAYFRNIITWEQYKTIIAKGDLRPAYTNVILDATRQILTADQYLEAALRGWTTLQKAKDSAAKHGMSDADAQLLYQVRRRPMTVRQITQALEWGGVFDTTNAPFDDPYESSVHEADLGPEWYGLAKSLKHTYSVPFWWRSMVQDGALEHDRAVTILKRIGNPPDFAEDVFTHFSAPTAAGTDPHVAKAQTQLWTTTHSAYKNGEVDQAEVTRNLSTLGVPQAAQTQVLTLWNAERDTYRKQLTPTQLKKAWRGAALNPATSAAWTKDEVLAALIARGYSPNDANTFLEL